MIGFLKGKIINAKPTKLLIDVNGVGYLVNISINTYEKISSLEGMDSHKDEVELFIYTAVREDAINLFGFYSESEKEMFEILISVSGIGPKLAQTILSGIEVDNLKDAIQSNNISRLINIPGIGRKTAERLIVELKGKVDSITAVETKFVESNVKSEAIIALSSLGYNIKIAEKVVREIVGGNNNISLEELIKKSLSILNK